MNEKLEIFYNI